MSKGVAHEILTGFLASLLMADAVFAFVTIFLASAFSGAPSVGSVPLMAAIAILLLLLHLAHGTALTILCGRAIKETPEGLAEAG